MSNYLDRLEAAMATMAGDRGVCPAGHDAPEYVSLSWKKNSDDAVLMLTRGGKVTCFTISQVAFDLSDRLARTAGIVRMFLNEPAATDHGGRGKVSKRNQRNRVPNIEALTCPRKTGAPKNERATTKRKGR